MILEFDSKNGIVYVEVQEQTAADSKPRRGEQPAGIEVPAGAPRQIVERAQKTFEEALASAKPGIEATLDVLSSLIKTPDEMEVEFGLKIDAKAGALLTSAGAEATLKVTLTWKKS